MNISRNLSFENFVDLHISYIEELICGILMTVAIIVTLIGNVLVILAVCKHNTQKSLHQVQNYFLVSLAFADLTVAVIVMPLSASYYIRGYWAHGNFLCNMWRTLDICLCTASILNLCAIALDRYWAITDPVKYTPKRTKKRICFIIAFVWLLSGLISVPPLLGWDEMTNSQQQRCVLSQQRAFIILSSSTSFYIPFIVMSVVYFRIYRAVRVRGRRAKMHTPLYQLDIDKNSAENGILERRFGSQFRYKKQRMENLTGWLNVIMPDHPSDIPSEMETAVRKKRKEHYKINLKKERRAARTLGIILGAFTICWLPFFLMYVIMPFCKSCQHPGRRVEAVITWIGYVNSACNPIVYTIFNGDFRSAFFNLLFGKCVKYRRKRCLEKKLGMKALPN
ncbi:LOW QUALITY PROTEIN: probable G-protein coupled receptor No18 [Amphiura filiformis]|uniref:LOW QUALITY PROTEIN: probable G-protein coupled receptor No18 n=1 Tax=Amphiura filiformis TaxID=82378 RepID=UPI003B21B9D6